MKKVNKNYKFEKANNISVASIGRSGSSVLFRSISKKQIVKKGKTHKFPTDIPDKFEAVIFTFANPIDVIKSLYNIYHENILIPTVRLKGKDFIEAHAKNMHASYKEAEEVIKKIPYEDVFKLESMFDAFCINEINNKPWRLATVRYETMWPHKSDLEKFLGGVSINLPKYTQRPNANKNIPEEIENQIEKTYKNLKEKINNMENIEFFIP